MLLRNCGLASMVCLLFATIPARAAVDFSRDILPILSENCYHCHGPDEAARKAGLRLDTKEGAFRKKKDRTMIVPGKSAESEVIARVFSKDAEDMMPPPDSNRKLTPKQIALLKQWVDEGAKWGTHWSYMPLPRATAVPKSAERNPIDAFVAAGHISEGFAFSAESTKEAWLRRATFDLTGLPPTLPEIDAFKADVSATAHETVVDRLLASPRYGERMAVEWLDLARYADTHGYQSDRFRQMWPFRDWVIRAFNSNQPYDEFATWQLAGDMLPNPTKDQRLATAFNRLHMQNEEGGVVEEEFRVAYVADRVNTFGTTFLAQTFECCRCHDHKFDPILQKDYYKLFAFFQNIDESGQTSYFTNAMPVPTLLLSTDEQDAKIRTLVQNIDVAKAALTASRASAPADFEKWLAIRPKEPALPGLVASFDFDELKANQSPNGVDAKQPANGHDGPMLVDGKRGKAVSLNGENGFDIPGVGHFSRSDPFSFSMWIRAEALVPRAVILHHSKAPIDAGSRGYELLLENGHVALGLHHMWPGNSLKVSAKTPIRTNTWTHITVAYDGSGHADGVQITLDGKPAEREVIRNNLRKDTTYEDGEPNLALGNRFRDNGFRGGAIDDLKIFARAITPIEAAHLAGLADFTTAWTAKTLPPIQRESLLAYYLSAIHEPSQKPLAALKAARTAHAKFVHAIPEAMVMEELPTPKPAFVLTRGAYDSHGEAVTATTPAFLGAYPDNLPKNRLGLAKWATSPDHPLFARVAVNRLWQQMFGSGLVESSDNFGSTGQVPTHPELLDFLARDFIEHKWDMKRMLRNMALSRTYRQSSRTDAARLQKDPYNLLLSNAPVRRLTAEMLRDQSLFASGLLHEKLGGPSVYPYQPEGLWNEALGRPNYPQSKGTELHRRSLYTVWKRTAPHPQMSTFDAADRSVCSAKRQSTSTPLQALALLNDTQIVEAARFLGERMLREGGTTAKSRATWVFRTVCARVPSERELAVLVKLYDEQKASYATDHKAAEKLLSVGEGKRDPKLDVAEAAAATQLSLAILNHDDAVTRR